MEKLKVLCHLFLSSKSAKNRVKTERRKSKKDAIGGKRPEKDNMWGKT